MFPLQAKPRMSAMFVHIENATGGRFSKWLAHREEKFTVLAAPSVPGAGWGEETPCAGLPVGSPRHPGADKTLTSQSRSGCVQTCVALPSEQKTGNARLAVFSLLLSPPSLFHCCHRVHLHQGVVSALAHSSLSSRDLSGPQWSRSITLRCDPCRHPGLPNSGAPSVAAAENSMSAWIWGPSHTSFVFSDPPPCHFWVALFF